MVNLPHITDTLNEISESSHYHSVEIWSKSTRQTHFQIQICAITVICNEFLSRINIVLELLQSNSTNFGSCLEHLIKLQEYFQINRGDVSMRDAFSNKAEQIVEQIYIPVEFSIHDSISRIHLPMMLNGI